MFKNDNDYDEVSAYHKQQKNINQNKDKHLKKDQRFENRDDFEYNNTYQKEIVKDDEETSSVSSQKDNRSFNIIITIVSVVIALGIMAALFKILSSI